MKYECRSCGGDGVFGFKDEDGIWDENLCSHCNGAGEFNDLRKTFTWMDDDSRLWSLLVCGLLLPEDEKAAVTILDRWPSFEFAMRDLSLYVHADGDLASKTVPTDWLRNQIGHRTEQRVRSFLHLVLTLHEHGLPRARSDILSLKGADDFMADCVLYYAGSMPEEAPPSGDPIITDHWRRYHV